MKIWLRRLALTAAVLCGLVFVLGVGSCVVFSDPRPTGISDEAATALAHKMVDASGGAAWQRTGAVTWTYGGRYNHLWDRDRQLVRVRKGDWEALIDIQRVRGIASEGGVALTGEAREEAVQEAYAAWANDSFWLNAPNKAFDPGTTRARVVLPDGGGDALLIAYSSGGVTPGDAYLWHLDAAGRPVSWQMWVSIIPIGGLSATWEGWVQLPTGAWVSTSHHIGPVHIEVTELNGAETLAKLVSGADPFKPLLDALAK
jgi:hypothetical protein